MVGLLYSRHLRHITHRLRLRSCFKIPQLARYGVTNRFKMLIYTHVNCAFSQIYALSRTHLRDFRRAYKCGVGARSLSFEAIDMLDIQQRLFPDTYSALLRGLLHPTTVNNPYFAGLPELAGYTIVYLPEISQWLRMKHPKEKS